MKIKSMMFFANEIEHIVDYVTFLRANQINYTWDFNTKTNMYTITWLNNGEV